MLNFQSNNVSRDYTNLRNKTMSESLDYLLAHTPHTFHNLLRFFFATGSSNVKDELFSWSCPNPRGSRAKWEENGDLDQSSGGSVALGSWYAHLLSVCDLLCGLLKILQIRRRKANRTELLVSRSRLRLIDSGTLRTLSRTGLWVTRLAITCVTAKTKLNEVLWISLSVGLDLGVMRMLTVECMHRWVNEHKT